MDRRPSIETIVTAFVVAAIVFASCTFNYSWPELSLPEPKCQPQGAGSKVLDGLEATPLARNMTLPRDALERGIAHMGSLNRFDIFLYKVIVERKPITAVAVGGSITALVGGQRGDQGEMFNRELQACTRQCNLKNGWAVTPLTWLTDRFPPKTMHPRASFNSSGRNDTESPFQLVNLGICGRGPDIYFTCFGKLLLDSLPQDVDLLLLDYSINFPTLNADSKGLVESFLQTVWGLNPGVAVLFVNFHNWCRPNDFTFAACRNSSDGPKQSSPRTWETLRGTYYDYTEEKMQILSRYYDLPSLSFRDALLPLVANQAPGYGILDIVNKGDPGWHPSVEQADGLYSDLTIHFLHSAIVSYTTRTRQRMHDKHLPSKSSGPLWYPPPEFSSTLGSLYQEEIEVCYFFDGLGARGGSRDPQVVRNKGFQFQPDDDAVMPEVKRGFITRVAGSIAEVRVDSKPLADTGATIVRVYHLKSYERMGKASYRCSRGCTCQEGLIDSTHEERASVPGFQDIFATFAPTGDCHIVFETQVGVAGGTKWKILSIEVIGLKKGGM